MADELQLRFNRAVAIVGLVALTGAVTGGICLIFLGHGGARAAGAIVVLVCAAPLVVTAVAAVRPPPAIIFSDDGLCAPSAGLMSQRNWRRAPIPWGEISGIVVFTYSIGAVPGPQNIGIVPTNGTAAIWRRHLGRRINQVLCGFPIVLSVAALPVTVDDLFDLLTLFKPTLTMATGGTRPATRGPLSWYPRPK